MPSADFNSAPCTHWRYRDRITGREIKCISNFPVPPDDIMAAWVARHFRNAEYIPGSAQDWDRVTDAGTLYPVPIQNVQWDCKTPQVYAPAPQRMSVFVQPGIQRKPISRKPLFR